MNQIIYKKNIFHNILHIDLILFLPILCILLFSIFITWSASGQSVEIIQQKIIQIIIGFIIMILLAQIPPKKYEMYALHTYNICLILLILVNITGHISKGAQRWLDLGLLKFQPSEIVKFSILLITAYYLNKGQYPPSIKRVCIVLLLTTIPAVFILLQPDLGTTILTMSTGLFVLFLSGISWKLIIIILSMIISLIPIFWFFFMYPYQKIRISILWNPEIDPLGSGYHIIQSKIAIGSGGLIGKGWLHGTQSQLEFLPERHTDFIFSVIGEEFGFLGISMLFILYLIIILRGFFIAINVQHMFGRLVTGGSILIFFMTIFMNIGMVTGILPVVGMPLPLVSYGGSSLLVLMAEFGCIMSMHSHRKMISKVL
ncbi:rod shape-determining protein RodA [Candidatus Blochmanniella vafra str. BVAF]|uniref:Peptidoglycan glycosyltransferase MrdB n=1 Tax=Blochmanniella vafra (strain BVAF) TaxID=859654 RepID=E8Q6W1_BLOVB|nr:rod shape-determining protein RodA [Candidatus Blochmannia vafer]ADV33708.1 rod shape-determining protein RodA [Candidatus Blochmannia vafer str. BVAF]